MARSANLGALKGENHRPTRYLVVGALCALTNNVIMIAGDLLGGHYLALSVLAFALVTPMAYWLHTAFTFGARRSLRSLLLFSAGVATGFPLSVLVTAFLYSGLGAPMIVAAPVTTIVLICWNYCSASWSIGAEARRRLALKALGRN